MLIFNATHLSYTASEGVSSSSPLRDCLMINGRGKKKEKKKICFLDISLILYFCVILDHAPFFWFKQILAFREEMSLKSHFLFNLQVQVKQ